MVDQCEGWTGTWLGGIAGSAAIPRGSPGRGPARIPFKAGTKEGRTVARLAPEAECCVTSYGHESQAGMRD